MIENKIIKLSRCDLNFLTTLAEKVNLSYRYYKSKDKSSLLKTLSNKFDSKTVDLIVKMYLLCYDAEDIAKMVKPNGMDDIVKVIPDFFGPGNYFYEVSLGKRICDIVLLRDGEVTAIEVKSESDDIVRAIRQVEYYKLWANKVYLAYDVKHKQKVKRLFIEHKIGLLEYTDDKLEMEREALLNVPDTNMLLSFTTYNYLRALAKRLRINAKGTKKEMANRMVRILSQKHVEKIFQDFLKIKFVSLDKVAKQFVETEQTYPLEQFLDG